MHDPESLMLDLLTYLYTFALGGLVGVAGTLKLWKTTEEAEWREHRLSIDWLNESHAARRQRTINELARKAHDPPEETP